MGSAATPCIHDEDLQLTIRFRKKMNDFRCSDRPVSFNCFQGLQNTFAALELRFLEYLSEEFSPLLFTTSLWGDQIAK